MKRAGIVVAVLVLLAGTAAGGFFLLRPDGGRATENDIRAAVDTFAVNLQGGDVAEAREVMCPPLAALFTKQTDKQFAAVAKNDTATEGTFVVDRYDTITVSGDRAKVTMIGHTDGEPVHNVGEERYEVGLAEIDGHWAVCKMPEPDTATQHKLERAEQEVALRKAVDDYFALFDKGDLPGVLHNSCGDLAAQLGQATPESFREYTSANPLTVRSVDEVLITGQGARVTVSLDSPSQGSIVEVLAMTREGERWKICGETVLDN